ncbi:DUF1330 domain-containing protein [Phenylobacterium immobile]|uniref:DUF1330 domain-containing protein n=1 Tax=Phenylobacterium immobile TaxID=21 RepID=UPI000B0E08A3|nr:DUF1330 domain-containing protein [Phenylobacterium immobile]
MSAYIIAIRDETTDAEGMAAYSAAVGAARRPDMKALAANGRVEALEGAPAEGVVLLEFPTFEDAKAWYDSPAYQAAREHRLGAATFRFLLIQGL